LVHAHRPMLIAATVALRHVLLFARQIGTDVSDTPVVAISAPSTTGSFTRSSRFARAECRLQEFQSRRSCPSARRIDRRGARIPCPTGLDHSLCDVTETATHRCVLRTVARTIRMNSWGELSCLPFCIAQS